MCKQNDSPPNSLFHSLQVGELLADDGTKFKVPTNIQVGENTRADSATLFKQFFSRLPIALTVGSNVTFFRSFLATEPNAHISIGDYCFISYSSIACYQHISIGNYVFIAGGCTIVDSDFHPLDPAARIADSISVSSPGNRDFRPFIKSDPVKIGDNVWIGYNATILKGVTIGNGAVIQPGSVVVDDIPSNAIVGGNPARVQ